MAAATTRIKGQYVRDHVHLIIKTWMEMFPREVLAFAMSCRLQQHIIRDRGLATVAKSTAWCPTYKFPERLDICLSKQFGEPGKPLDWQRDPMILDIVVDELSLCKMVKNPGRIR